MRLARPRIPHTQVEADSHEAQDTLIIALAKAQCSLGNCTIEALARRASMCPKRATQARCRLSERGLIGHVGSGEACEWHLTDDGWSAVGMQKPLWLDGAA